MPSRHLHRAAFLETLLLTASVCLLTSCGGQSIDMPEDLRITVFPQGEQFDLVVVMKWCSDQCATYDAPSCKASVEGNTIKLDASVHYSRDNSKKCSELCGPPIIAHCNVGPLGSGAYTVVSGSFQKGITIR